MSKRLWTLIIVVVALGAVIGAYFWITRPKAAPAVTQGAKTELSKGDKDSIVKITLADRAEGTLVLVKKGDAWTTDPALPVTFDQSNIDDLLYSFSSLLAERVIDPAPTDLSQYGLKPARATAVATWKDGTEHTIYLGDKTEAGNTYYLQVKGDPKVYSVWMNNGEHYHWKLADLRSKTISPALKYDEVTYIKLTESNGTVIEARAKTPEESKTYQLGFGSFMLLKPYSYQRGLDSEKQDAFLKGAQNIAISTFVEDNPKDLGKYGLAHPSAELIVKDKTSSIDFLFGSAVGSASETYFMIKGQPSVYSTDSSSLSFLATKPFDIVDKFTFIPNIDDVDGVTIHGGGATHTLAITRTSKKADKAGDPDVVVATYAVDGKNAEEDNFKKFYQALIGLQVEGESARRVPNIPEVSVTFNLNKGTSRTVRVDYANYDRDFDAIFLNGINEFALTKGQLTNMLAKLDLLVKGEKVPD